MVFTFTRRQWVLFGMLSLLVLCVVFVPQIASADVVKGILTVLNAVVGGLAKGMEVLLGLFQFLFLEVIEFTILNFASAWDGGFLSDFRVVWQVIRDFVNLVIVVLFILTAMMTAFGEGREGFGFHRKSLIFLIVAAIFVNFSAFFTLLVLDVSHILFMLFFNALDTASWGSLSPFTGYSVILGEVGDGGLFNLIVSILAIVVNWFIILGILYFCIILIERYIIAMFLVLLSPLAALGFFAGLSGGNPLASKFVGIYEQWKEKLGYVFSMPVVLILGFTLLLVLFQGALGQTADPDNFVKLLGVKNPQGRGILIQLVMASIVLILGIFKVGEVAKKANIHPAIAGKFKLGEFLGERANSLWKGKPFLGAARALKGSGRGAALASEFINRTPRIARKVYGVVDTATKVGRIAKGVVGGVRRGAQDVDDVLQGRSQDEESVEKRTARSEERKQVAQGRVDKAAKRLARRRAIDASTQIREAVQSALHEQSPTVRSKKIIDILKSPMKDSISGGEWSAFYNSIHDGNSKEDFDIYGEMMGSKNVPPGILAAIEKKIRYAVRTRTHPGRGGKAGQTIADLEDMLVKGAGNVSLPVDIRTSMLKDSNVAIRQEAVKSFAEQVRTASPDEQRNLLNIYAKAVGKSSRTPDVADFEAYQHIVANENSSPDDVALIYGKIVDELAHARGPGRGFGESGKKEDEILAVLHTIADNGVTSSETLGDMLQMSRIPDALKDVVQRALVAKTDLRTDAQQHDDRVAHEEQSALQALATLIHSADPSVLADLVSRPARGSAGQDYVMTEELFNQVLDRAVEAGAGGGFAVIEEMSNNFKATNANLERLFDEVKKDVDRVDAGQAAFLESDIDKLESVFENLANNISTSVEDLQELSQYSGIATSNASKISAVNVAAAKMLARKLGQAQRRTEQKSGNQTP